MPLAVSSCPKQAAGSPTARAIDLLIHNTVLDSATGDPLHAREEQQVGLEYTFKKPHVTRLTPPLRRICV